FSPPDYIELTQHKDLFASIGSFVNAAFEISGSGESERVRGARITASLLETLGWDPILVRGFTEAEDTERLKVALLSHGYCKRKLGQDASIIGRQSQLDRQSYPIIGVLRPDFVFPPRGLPTNGLPADIFVPMSFFPYQRQA